MKVIIPNQIMREKLERLLSDVPGKFEHYPRRVTGFDQLVIFRKNGIPCPDFTIHLEEARGWVANGSDVFGRNKIHEKGKDIVSQTSPLWASKEFWTKVVSAVNREYRIHVFDGRHIQQGLKWFDPNAVKQRNDGLPIRNTETGWKYNHEFSPPSSAVELAKRAVQVLGYLWGAVDFIEDESRDCYVLEVNSAPGMDATTADAYADAIKIYAQRVKSI